MALVGTPFEVLYTVFGVQKDDALCTRMAHIGVIYTVLTGIFSICTPAPYGRFSNQLLGRTINAKLAWTLQECMAFICPAVLIVLTPGYQLHNYSNIVAITLFMFHYFHRSIIYPRVMSSNSKPVPIIIIVSAVTFCTFNGIMQGVHLINVIPVKDSFNVFSGTFLYLIGMGINITHDRMLISLKSNIQTQSEEGEAKIRYKIPRGGLFEYVSGANYLGEIIEWIGWAWITGGYPQIVFAIFSAMFLGIRAVHNHRFYLDTFGKSYPKSRKAIIPFQF